MGKYNWQKKDWLDFTYRLKTFENELFLLVERIGRVSGMWDSLPENAQQESVIDLMVAEAVKTSVIEGEYITRYDVLSSIRKNLGLREKTNHIKDKRAKGIAELMIDVRKSYREPLTKEKLFTWHRILLGERKNLNVGTWRTHKEPMQVVSGAMGKEIVHYEAPPSSRVPEEMRNFIAWFNKTIPKDKQEIKSAPIRSALSHLYFESIHPFEDGNGRIGRAIAEKALSQGIGRPVLLSLSDTIESDRSGYYNALKKAQQSNEVTGWIQYFVHSILEAQTRAEELIDFTLKKTSFFDHYQDKLNSRQLKVINRMLEDGPNGFEGGMNARKYVNITKTSKATATRDLQYLLKIGAIKHLGKGGGRSTRYQVNL